MSAYGPGPLLSKRSWSNHTRQTDYRAEFGMNGHELPKPDDIVHYADGSFLPMMFHFAGEGIDLRAIALEQGFDLKGVSMENVVEDDDPIFIDYFEKGCSDVLLRWQPPQVAGWDLVGKFDAEDGPMALYLRRCKEVPR
ncbi:hypothetical protein [Hyphomicrobium sp.]|uniref:hypothetical protein n=1 Tax=Hyphomicrobium sp. TaxID=82 RepID=UPI001D9A75EA|nr:hypothetical protein [Hyphomicrobium sp.]MBY0561449.1 hypothetical protein [Hyphomicrobium sp.]